MKYLFSVCFLACVCSHAFADPPADPEKWYRESYAPLWEKDPGSKIDKILAFYANAVAEHPPGGTAKLTSSTSWLREAMQAWVADGWESSALQDLVVDRINATTVSFKAAWRDRYANAADELSCGWYLADYENGAWIFTAYADIDCAAHGFTLGGRS